MKNLKRKDLILEHYKLAVKATVIERDYEIVVRVHKPKTMGNLPAYKMLCLMQHAAHELPMYREPKDINAPREGSAVWITRNPDYGLFDAQVVERMDFKHRCVDIYFCSLLVRPFSEEARLHYEKRMGLEPWDRLLLMWDSRQFDEDGGYDRRYGINNRDWPDYNSFYRVVDQLSDIEDGTL